MQVATIPHITGQDATGAFDHMLIALCIVFLRNIMHLFFILRNVFYFIKTYQLDYILVSFRTNHIKFYCTNRV